VGSHEPPGLRIKNVIAPKGIWTGCYLLRIVLAACVGLLWSLRGTARAGSPTLDAIRARGNVVCAMQTDNVRFSLPDSKGIWRGMDVDICPALATAVFADPSKIVVRPVTGMTPMGHTCDRGRRRLRGDLVARRGPARPAARVEADLE
jgi:hypothetical protein